MNPEFSPETSDDFELRLTAYLLGELTPVEAAQVETELDNNPALRKLKAELEFTLGLVREVIRNPADSEPNPMASDRPQLSETRRTALLETLRHPPLLPLPQPTPRRDSLRWMIPMAVAASLIGLLSLQEFSLNSVLPRTALAPGSSQTNVAILAVRERSLAESKSAEALQLQRGTVPSTSLALEGRGFNGRAPMPAPSAVPSKPQASTDRMYALKPHSAPNEFGTDTTTRSYFFSGTAGAPPPVSRQLDSVASTLNRPVTEGIPSQNVLAEKEAAPTTVPATRPAAPSGDSVANGATTLRFKKLEDQHQQDRDITTWMFDGVADQKNGNDDRFSKDSPADPSLQANVMDSLSAAAQAPITTSRFGKSDTLLDSAPVLGFYVSPDQARHLVRESIAQPKSVSQTLENPRPAIALGVASAAPAAIALQTTPLQTTPPQEPVIGQSDFVAVPPTPVDAFIELNKRGENPAADLYSIQARTQIEGKFITDSIPSLQERHESLQRIPAPVAKAEAPVNQATDKQKAENVLEGRLHRKPLPSPVPQPEISTTENAFSTFSLNVTDVSFKLAASSLANNALPAPATIRSEEFINAFEYRDPEPASGQPMAFAWDRAASPFNQNRDLLRFSLKTAALGRESGRPINVVLLLDKSGSMERPDRVETIREALVSLGKQLKTGDRLSVVTFARTPRLLAEAVSIDTGHIGELAQRIANIPAEGGTNLEEAMKLAYATASRQFLLNGPNRVVLLTDGAANLGEVEPASLQSLVESWRQRGVALDCFGVGWDGLNDSLLATLASHGDGRYGLINTPEEAQTRFASQLAGALQVAAADVKVQVEFNPQRVSAWRPMGYATHQLTQEQFRDNRVDAAELAAAESGNALYTLHVNPQGSGPIATVWARFRDPVATVYRELSWTVPYSGVAQPLNASSPRMRLAASSALFSEWLAQNPHAADVSPTRLLDLMRGVPDSFSPDPLPKQLELMIHQAQSIFGN